MQGRVNREGRVGKVGPDRSGQKKCSTLHQIMIDRVYLTACSSSR